MAKEIPCEFCTGTESAHARTCEVLSLYFEIAINDEPRAPPPRRSRRDLADRRARQRILEHSSEPLIDYVASIYDPSVSGDHGEEVWPEVLEEL